MVQSREFATDAVQVNRTTAGSQALGGIAPLAGGGYVVVWMSPAQLGTGEVLFARVFGQGGEPVDEKIVLAGDPDATFLDVTVCALADGGFTVSWAGSGEDSIEIHARRFSADGTALGRTVRVNADSTGDQYGPAITALADGGFAIAWVGNDEDGSGIRLQRFSASGELVGQESVVNAIQTYDQHDPAIASLAGGGLVIAWTAWGLDGDGDGIFARILAPDGSLLAGDVSINQSVASDQYSPAIAALADGGFAVAWTSWTEDGDGEGVVARVFDASGVARSDAFVVGVAPAGDQFQPMVTALADGSFVVAWISEGNGPTSVMGRFFGPDGLPAGEPIQISGPLSSGAKFSPMAAALDGGGLAFAWTEWGIDGSGWGVAAREMVLKRGAAPYQVEPDIPLPEGLEDQPSLIRASALLAGWAHPEAEHLEVAELSASQGALVDNGNGTWTLVLPEDFHGSLDLSYQVRAAGGGTTATVRSMTIAPVNDAPRLVDDQAELAAGTEDTGFIVTVADLLTGFADVEGQDLVAENLTADHGRVEVFADGSALVTPERDFSGTLTLSYRVSDGEGAATDARLVVVVSAINDAPELRGQAAVLAEGREDIAYHVDVRDLLAGFVDPEGEALRIEGLSADNGIVAAPGGNTFTIIPDARFNGLMTLAYKVVDATGAETAATLAYTVAAAPDGPLAIVMTGGTVREMAARGTPVAAFTARDPAGGPVRFSLVDDAGSRFAIHPVTGALSVRNGSLLDHEAASVHSVTVRVAGAGGEAISQVFAIRVDNVVEQQRRILTSGSDTFVAPSDDHWIIDASFGHDRVLLASGNDVVRGAGGNDSLSGGAGNDLFVYRGMGEGFDAIEGGPGWDEIQAQSRNTVIGLSSLSGVEAVSGNGFAGVRIAGSGAGDRLDFSGVSLRWIEAIDGGAGSDTITGSAGNDILRGGRGDDRLAGGPGDDTFVFAGWRDGFDMIEGGEGRDRIVAADDRTSIGLHSLGGVETISANGHDHVTIRGNSHANRLDFSQVTLIDIARIDGGGGNDTIVGSAGRDRIEGGAGADVLTGGGGRDAFEFRSTAHSRATSIDLILDFERGSDRIDLSEIDANSRWGGNQAFTYIGRAEFQGVAGELRLSHDAAIGLTIVSADTDGDRQADLVLHLVGQLNLSASDFLL